MLADCPASVVIDVVLLADGLGAAACEHGIAPFDVRLFRSGPGRVRVEVEPIPGRPDLGLGARVLDSVSTRWGFGPDGLLWAERELDDISRS